MTQNTNPGGQGTGSGSHRIQWWDSPALHVGSISDHLPSLLSSGFWATAAPTSDLPEDPPIALTDPRLRVREIKLRKDKHYFQSALRD